MQTKQARGRVRRPGRATSGRERRSDMGRAVIVEGDRTTHVILPIEEYERMIVAEEARAADRILSDPNTEWYDADDVFRQLTAEGIVKARKARGLTQKQLGDLVGVPQSQISRIERNPDRTTVRTLKKLARALGVQLGALL